MKKIVVRALSLASLGFSAITFAQSPDTCDKWRFLLEADQGENAAFLVGEIDTSLVSRKSFSEVTDTAGLRDIPEPSLTLNVGLSEDREGYVDYDIEAIFYGPEEGAETVYQISESELLRDGYISMSHQGSATFTLFGQKLACGEEVL